MDGACGMYEGERDVKLLVWKREGRDHVEDLNVDGSMIIKVS
jgi:hypothetical protein